MTPDMITSVFCVITNANQDRIINRHQEDFNFSVPFTQCFNIILDGCRVQNEPREAEAAPGPGPHRRQGNRQEEEEGRPQNRNHRRQEAPVQSQEALR